MKLTNRELADNSTFPIGMTFLGCQHCNYLSHDFDDRVAVPCPNCGKPGYRRVFPSLSGVELLKMISYFYSKACDIVEEKKAALIKTLSGATSESLAARAVVQVSRGIKTLYRKSKDTEETYDNILELIQKRLFISADQAKKVFQPLFRYSETVHEQKVVVILTCTLLEELLANQLVLVLSLRGMSRPAAWKQVKDLSGFKGLCQQFENSLGISISKAMSQYSKRNFHSNWCRIVKARNTFIHGNPYAINASTAETAFNLAKNSFSLFAYLQNHFCLKRKAGASSKKLN